MVRPSRSISGCPAPLPSPASAAPLVAADDELLRLPRAAALLAVLQPPGELLRWGKKNVPSDLTSWKN